MMVFSFVGYAIDSMVFVLDIEDGKWAFSGPKRVTKIIIDKDGIWYEIMMVVTSVRNVFEFEVDAEDACIARNELMEKENPASHGQK